MKRECGEGWRQKGSAPPSQTGSYACHGLYNHDTLAAAPHHTCQLVQYLTLFCIFYLTFPQWSLPCPPNTSFLLPQALCLSKPVSPTPAFCHLSHQHSARILEPYPAHQYSVHTFPSLPLNPLSPSTLPYTQSVITPLILPSTQSCDRRRVRDYFVWIPESLHLPFVLLHTHAHPPAASPT